MKIIGIGGSPRKEGSTSLYALKRAMEEVKEQGLDGEIISLAGKTIVGCTACGACKKTGICAIDDDFSREIFQKLNDPEVKGFIFASPVYMGGITAQMKAFLDRTVVFRRNGFLWEDKVAGAITVGHSRNGGQELAVLDIVKSCMIHGMIIVPDASSTCHFGGMLHSGVEGGISEDETGLKTTVNLAQKVAKTVLKLHR